MSRRMCIPSGTAALICVVMLLAACGGQPPAAAPTQTPASTSPAVQEQPPSPTPAVEVTPTFTIESSPTAVPALNGQALVEERCTACHTLDRVRQSRKSEADWKATVERMVRKGAVLSAEEVEAVVRYLVQMYP